MRRWLIAAALAIATVRPAVADDASYRAVVDQVVLEPSALGGQRLRVTLSLVQLTGQTVDLLDSESVRVDVDGSRLDAPFAIGAYGGTTADTAIVLVVQTSLDFTDVLPVIADTFGQNVLANLGDHVQVAIVPYGESQGHGKLGSVRAAGGRLAALGSDGSVGDPKLLDTLDRALSTLRRADTEPEGRPLRKMIVVVSDGRDVSADRARVRRLGRRAGKEGVRIHSFAYSPSDTRRPLLLLGELSKQSHGTFRWIRGARADSWGPVFQQLHAEIQKQHVLTYFLPAGEDVSGKKLEVELVGRARAKSNAHKIPDVACNGVACEAGAYCAADRCVQPLVDDGLGVLGWILLIVGILVGALLALGLIGYAITKRQQAGRPGVPGVPAVPGVPGVPGMPGAAAAPGTPPVPGVPAGAPVPSTAPPSMPPGTVTGPRLCFMSGPHAGREVPLRHGLLIGKAPGCDLVIDDGYTSSQHAQIGMDHFGNCRIYDHGSTNGTYVNGVKVTEYALEHGNSVRIGSTELRFLAQ